jgi:protocatechuate 3,4-dioxygenase beta subunit
MINNLQRRQFLKFSAIGVGTAALSLKAAAAASCSETPEQTSGPFFPGENQFSPDNDLTVVDGAKAAPLGQVIYIHGIVRDALCRPLAGVNVEIWQACASGRYNNKNDPNTAPLDPNFKYWGEAITDHSGAYLFKTIIPGAYPADTDWVRPPHIHFKLSKLGYHELITQMYFGGQSLNAQDKILLEVPQSSRPNVIVDFQPNPAQPGTQLGKFDITLLKV